MDRLKKGEFFSSLKLFEDSVTNDSGLDRLPAEPERKKAKHTARKESDGTSFFVDAKIFLIPLGPSMSKVRRNALETQIMRYGMQVILIFVVRYSVNQYPRCVPSGGQCVQSKESCSHVVRIKLSCHLCIFTSFKLYRY